MPPDADEVRRWLEKAVHDWRTAEAALSHREPVTDTAAFHCQQAVEKVLKAFLVSRNHEFALTHDLRLLVQDCMSFDASFASLLPTVAPLIAYAVRFRYPGPVDPTVEQVQAALATVHEVWRFVLSRLPEDVRPSETSQ